MSKRYDIVPQSNHSSEDKTDIKTVSFFIDCILDGDHHDVHYNGMPFIRRSSYRLIFRCAMLVNGRRSVEKEFIAYYSSTDLEGTVDKLVDRIIGQLKKGTIIGIWDNAEHVRFGEEVFVSGIELSPMAEELFNFLFSHKQRLIEAFT